MSDLADKILELIERERYFVSFVPRIDMGVNREGESCRIVTFGCFTPDSFSIFIPDSEASSDLKVTLKDDGTYEWN